MSAPTPVPTGPLVGAWLTVHIDADTALTEGIYSSGGLGFVRAGQSSSHVSLVFNDRAAVGRAITALERLHDRMTFAARHTSPTGSHIQVVPDV
jgi:hypothetical protein